jgi:hypothetical protein
MPPPSVAWPTMTGEEKLAIGICIGIVVLFGVGMWRRRQSSIC